MDFRPPVLHVGDIGPSDTHVASKHVRRVDMLGETIAYVLSKSVFLCDKDSSAYALAATDATSESSVLRWPLELGHPP